MPLQRLLRIAVPAAAMALGASAALAGEPSTTRIETRAFYGATVTIEEGVRVFRPLPSHNRVIINPGAKASVGLTFEENVTTSHNYNYGAPTTADPVATSTPDVSGVGPGAAAHHPARGGFKGIAPKGSRH